jgi:RHS repeat-associated protein
MYFYGVHGERLPYRMGSYVGQLTGTPAAYFAGRRLGWGATADRLGSVRVAAYYPYGEYEGTASGDDVRFATYVRDSATGLDYAVNRYYASIIGRFLSTDPSWASVALGDPQTWNRYVYALNDPVNGNDPDGLIPCGDLQIAGTGTISEVVTENSNLGLLSELVWAESDHTWRRQGSLTYDAEQDAIAWTVVNRWKILNGYLSVAGVSDPGALGWGPDYATVRQIIGQPGQFSTISGGIWHPQLRSDLRQTLADVMDSEPSAGDEVDLDLTSLGLGVVSMTHECFDVWQSEVAADFTLYGGSTDPFASAGYTTSFHHGVTTTPLQPFFGNFGTANNFFGIPAGSVTTSQNPGKHRSPIRPPKPPRPGRPRVQ